MFAVIKTGGKQYRVTDGDVIVVEKLAGEPGSSIKFDQVLMLGGSGETQTVGTPLVANATVTGEVLEQSRADKIVVFKKKRRQGYKRKAGHRQDQTVLRIVDINGSGKSAAKAAAPKKAEAPAKEDAPAKAAAPAKKKAAAASKAKASTASKSKAPAKKKSAAASKAKAPKSED